MGIQRQGRVYLYLNPYLRVRVSISVSASASGSQPSRAEPTIPIESHDRGFFSCPAPWLAVACLPLLSTRLSCLAFWRHTVCQSTPLEFLPRPFNRLQSSVLPACPSSHEEKISNLLRFHREFLISIHEDFFVICKGL